MNNEEKQALIERCKTVSSWREKYGDFANVMLPAIEAMEIAQIALDALTAQPVKLPSASEPHSSGYGCAYMVETKGGEWLEKSEVKAAIREAGYEVQE